MRTQKDETNEENKDTKKHAIKKSMNTQTKMKMKTHT